MIGSLIVSVGLRSRRYPTGPQKPQRERRESDAPTIDRNDVQQPEAEPKRP